MRKPKRYGTSPGGYVAIEPQIITFELSGGINLMRSPVVIAPAETPEAVDLRIAMGGITPDYDVADMGDPYSDAEDPNIMHIAPFQRESGTELLMRLRSTGWDRWNGAVWLTLPGALTGTNIDRYYSVIMKDMFIAANGVDRIKAWDGTDVNAVADLSADAPKAAYIIRIGNRLLAARINTGSAVNPNLVAWSGDGDITEWTSSIAGAGLADLLPEGGDTFANFITGLGAVTRGAVIFRQRSLVLASLTGAGAAPFRFQTVDFDHGTESPYSIASGGPMPGIYFLGSDYVVYRYDGQAIDPVGLPIATELRDSIHDLQHVVGRVDSESQEYWLAVPLGNDGMLSVAWILNIRETMIQGKPVWRKRLLVNTRTIAFGPIPTNVDPLVDSVLDLVDTVSKRVDDFAQTTSVNRMLFGSDTGDVRYIDRATALSTGTYITKQFTDDISEFQVDKGYITYVSPNDAEAEMSVSHDGGLTFICPRTYVLPATGSRGARQTSQSHGCLGKLVQFRIRILSGNPIISKVAARVHNRGRGVL